MAELSRQNGYEVYTIVSNTKRTRVSFVPAKGGVVTSIICPKDEAEREILFLPKDFWRGKQCELRGGLPFVFPVCARIERMGVIGNYLYEGHLFNMPIHGFAPYCEWQVIESKNPASLVLELAANKNTLAMYPFEFKVRLNYRVEEGKLSCEQTYSNCGNKLMPYYAGFHPYFLTPNPNDGKEKVQVNFSALKQFRYNERLTDIVGEKTLLELPHSIADPALNEQLFEVAADNVVQLNYPDNFTLFMCVRCSGKEQLFKYLQLYTIPNQPFICVEPWMAVPNAMNTMSGVRWLRPGSSEKAVFTIYTGK